MSVLVKKVNSMKYIDLRSDTVTKPTADMRRAMAEAEVGDDVYGEDPTLNRLERTAAQIMGKEAALFVASGTMGNLVAVLAHCERGVEAIVGDNAHIFYYEVGGASALGGVPLRTVPNLPNGMLDPDSVAHAIRTPNIHFPTTGLVCVENTHNRCGGVVLTVAQIKSIADVAHAAGAAVHMDGARIFNAAVALDVPVAALVADVDSVQFCLSKGLGAPVGSLVAGSAAFVAKARKLRKMVGGGMRQAGVLAAAGLIALTETPARLHEDHANARRLAEGLAETRGIEIDLTTVQTNIVVGELGEGLDADNFVAALRGEGLLINSMGGRIIRFVTHYDVSRDDMDAALGIIRRVAEGEQSIARKPMASVGGYA